MFRHAWIWAVLVGVVTPTIAAAQGENLLINGRFDAEQVAFPEFWTPSSSTQGVAYQRAGGPERRMPAVVLQGDGETRQLSLRQQGLTLAAGETYKLSAYLRTKGFKSRNAGLIVHNAGWTAETGIKNLPADSDWTYREKTFTLFPSRDKEYGVALFALEMTGELALADVKLEAVSDGARAGSRSQLALVAAPRLVPYRPLLNQIPKNNPELAVKVFGILAAPPTAYEGRVSIDGKAASKPGIPLADGQLRIALAGLALGDHQLRIALCEKADGKTVVEATFPITLVDRPTVDAREVKPLNNLATELLDRPLRAGGAAQSFDVPALRDGWIFLAVAGQAAAAPPTVDVDGQAVSLSLVAGQFEAFRQLPMGMHKLSVRCASDGRLIVRSIPEIFDYPPCANSKVSENGPYDWEFMKRHVLPAVTTLNGGTLPGPALDEAKQRGLKWLANFNVAPMTDPADIRARMEKHAGLTQPQYDGLTSDELFFGRTTIDHYTKALWGLRNPDRRLIYTWIVGKPSIAALHTDFLAAALNASGGRGRILYEAYCHPQPDEAAANAYLDDMLTETMRRLNALYPNAAAGTGIIFGNFNQIPIISLETDPACDFKYFLDMQVNRIANRPEFAGLGMTGYWGTYYGDEELARWSFLLMRHYAVEGRRDMLSTRYGFRYHPGLLKNGDFAEGLAGWIATPAASDSIRTESLAGYGKNSQGRWGAGKAGDTACVLVRQASEPNRLEQSADGLTVGKAYCLQFVVADRRDVLSKKFNPRRYGIEVELPGAERMPARSYVHIDRRQGGKYAGNDAVGKINLHRVVFRATSSKQRIVFSDSAAQAGDESLLNFVQLKPYLD